MLIIFSGGLLQNVIDTCRLRAQDINKNFWTKCYRYMPAQGFDGVVIPPPPEEFQGANENDSIYGAVFPTPALTVTLNRTPVVISGEFDNILCDKKVALQIP